MVEATACLPEQRGASFELLDRRLRKPSGMRYLILSPKTSRRKMRSKRKVNRVVYRLWHNKSAAGRIGYIGKDKYYPKRVNLSYRKTEKGCAKLYRALNRYSLNFWKIDILKSGFRSDKSLSKAEIYYIRKFDSKNKGYNLTDGGDGVSGCHPSKETRIKLSNAKKNMSPETRAKLSIAALGNKRCVGRKLSVETKAKIGAGNKGKVYS